MSETKLKKSKPSISKTDCRIGFTQETDYVHIANLRRKLGKCGKFIRSERGVGYKFTVSGERV